MKRFRNEKQKELDGIEDAEQEVMMLDDCDNFPTRLGGVFVNLNQDDFTPLLEKMRNELVSDIKNFTTALEEVEERQSSLKKELYSRFGEQINLEY